MRVLVTGANGYLGGHLTQKLREDKHSVNCQDSHRNSLWQENDSWFGIDANAIVHLAWYSSVGDAQRELHEECLERTKELVDRVTSSRKTPLPLFVFASTTSVYGHRPDYLLSEHDRVNPQCAYTECKVKAEDYIRQNLPDSHLILRLGSLMGVGASGYRTKTQVIVNAFSVDGYRRGVVRVWNPLDCKPVVHVRDASRMIAECVNEGTRGTLNVAESCQRAIDIAGMVAKLTGARVEEMPVDPSGCGPRSINLGMWRTNHLFKWTLRTIEETVPEFREYEESPTDKNTPWKPAPKQLV
jgi:nucleoside-diphosphate-sugar epimerase